MFERKLRTGRIKDAEKEISPEALKITESRWSAYIKMLNDAGYISGVRIEEYIDGTVSIDISMEFDSGLAAAYTQWAKNVSVIETSHEKRPLTTEIAALVQEACRDAVDKALQRIPYRKQAPQCSFVPDYADVPEEVWPLLDRLQPPYENTQCETLSTVPRRSRRGC